MFFRADVIAALVSSNELKRSAFSKSNANPRQFSSLLFVRHLSPLTPLIWWYEEKTNDEMDSKKL